MGFEDEMYDLMDRQPEAKGGTVHISVEGMPISAEVYQFGREPHIIKDARIEASGEPYKVTAEIRALLIMAFRREYIDRRIIGRAY